MTPNLDQLFTASDETWPAARRWQDSPWCFREGRGGGKRVSAATAEGVITEDDINTAHQTMRDLGQTPLFMVRPQDAELDRMLDQQGHCIVDPVNIYLAPIDRLTDQPIPRVTTFTLWKPLAIMAEIWAEGGIGPERLAVMDRAKVKTGILARWNEKPGGVAFAALHENIAMVHAVEIPAHQRRQGVAGWIMRAAAFWAQKHGAQHIAVLCVKENKPANALYQSLGFTMVGGYHYRQSPDG